MISHTYGAEKEMCIKMKQTEASIRIKKTNKQTDRQTDKQERTLLHIAKPIGQQTRKKLSDKTKTKYRRKEKEKEKEEEKEKQKSKKQSQFQSVALEHNSVTITKVFSSEIKTKMVSLS